jgi:type II secretory pathway pseudopilin PulG
MPQPHKTHRSRKGFTIVELLAVIGAIALLLGFLLVGLQSATRAAKNTRSMSNLRQVFIAWSTYSSTYDDKLLPGYLTEDVQDYWRVRYKSPAGSKLDASLTSTYPLRLLPYLDNQIEPLYGYLEESRALKNSYANENDPDHQDALREISEVPEFGYNAYYLGGWWKMSNGSAHMIFGDTPADIRVGTQVRTVKGRLVALSLGDIRQPERQIAFSCSSLRKPGVYIREENVPAGAAWVVPPRLCGDTIWEEYGGTRVGFTTIAQSAGEGMEVFIEEAVPLRRHGISVPSMTCDGAAAQIGLADMLNMDRWTSVAIEAATSPREFTHECDPVSNSGT